jgi:replicative DNA helicase
MASKDRPVPIDLISERAVVASCVVHQDSIPQVAALLTPDDFFEERYRLIYITLLALYERRKATNLLSLRSQLEQEQTLAAVGGYGHLFELFEDGLDPLMAVGYAERVRETAIKRSLITAGGRIAGLGFEREAEADDLLGQAQEQLHAIVTRTSGSTWADAGGLLQAFDSKTEALSQPDSAAIIGSGLVELDDITGGFMAPDLILVAARPSMGKTAFALAVARHVCEPAARGGLGLRMAFFSLEMSREEIGERLVASLAGIDLAAVRTRRLSDQEWDSVYAAQDHIAGWGLTVDDSGEVAIDELRNRALALYAQQPFNILVVDYLQLVTGRRDKSSNREQEVASISRSLKALGKRLGVPVLALAQLNRAVEGRADKTPQLGDLRESGALEQDANIVILLHRPGVYDATKSDTTAQLLVAKNRNAKTGPCEVAWDGAHQRFGNLDRWHERRAA